MSWNQIAASADTAGSIVAAEEDGSGGGWDLVEFFTNGQDYAEKAGGAFLGVVGVVCLLFAAWKIFQKLTNEQSRESWGKVAGLVLLGGVLLFGGYSMISDLAEGGKDTVDNFGDTGGSNAMPASTGASDPLVIEIGDGAIARL
ncbi:MULTISPECIES: hypothetical protein [Gordonia]|uniref:hypothetical protein n=1 Tax=Gordonia TaxID=2053 RepID=UPI000299B11C|nr:MULTISPECIES: hypothetical protein [Gordonia]ADK68926.2 hypothetical protein KTR9_5140 [Gordonia sp. KTR9]MCZ4580433.1 hypothetical protein [Gordonia amicalis]